MLKQTPRGSLNIGRSNPALSGPCTCKATQGVTNTRISRPPRRRLLPGRAGTPDGGWGELAPLSQCSFPSASSPQCYLYRAAISTCLKTSSTRTSGEDQAGGTATRGATSRERHQGSSSPSLDRPSEGLLLEAQQSGTSTINRNMFAAVGGAGTGGYEWAHVSQTLASHVHRGMHLQGRAGTPDGVTRRPTDQCAILRSANETNSLPPSLTATRLPETLEMTCEALVRLDSKPRGSLDAPRAQPTWEVPARPI